MSDLRPGKVIERAGKVYGVCAECRGLVRIDKPFIGSLHLCEPQQDTLTDGDILAAATDGVAPYELCWRAFGPKGAERDEARNEIARLIADTKGQHQ